MEVEESATGTLAKSLSIILIQWRHFQITKIKRLQDHQTHFVKEEKKKQALELEPDYVHPPVFLNLNPYIKVLNPSQLRFKMFVSRRQPHQH